MFEKRPVDTLSPGQKAKRTGRWAKTMTKWLITHSTMGKKWRIVSFEGNSGGESRGIVDLVAIRRDHNCSNYSRSRTMKVGDLFELVLIQVKGGSAPFPGESDINRLKAVGKYYKARSIVLASWKKGKVPSFYVLDNKTQWAEMDTMEIFK